MRNSSKFPLPTIAIIEPPDSSSPPPQNGKPFKRQLSESFVSDSSDSSFDSLPDSDIQKIQVLTKALDSGIRTKLRQYKKSSFDYNQKHSFLKEKLKIYEKEFKEVENNYSDLLKITQKTQNYVKEIQKYPEKSPKTLTEENFTCQSIGEVSALDLIKKLKDDVIKIRDTMDRNDAEKLEAREKKNDFLLKRKLRSDKQNNELCNCRVI